MELITQPTGSYKCTQCCVAMVAGVSMKKSIQAFGLEHATNLYAMRNALKKLGFVAAEKYASFGRKERRLPDTCILRLKWPKQKLGHCVVFHRGLDEEGDMYDEGQVYDPAGYVLDWSDFLEMNCDAFITYLSINPA